MPPLENEAVILPSFTLSFGLNMHSKNLDSFFTITSTQNRNATTSSAQSKRKKKGKAPIRSSPQEPVQLVEERGKPLETPPTEKQKEPTCERPHCAVYPALWFPINWDALRHDSVKITAVGKVGFRMQHKASFRHKESMAKF
jgi:hypothetical protein